MANSWMGGPEMLQFAMQVLRGRWFMFFGTFLILSATGSTHLFGIYSKEIKTSLGYNQKTLNTLGFFKDLGANVGILSGLIAEVTPPWFVLYIGAIMNFSGYFIIWLAVTGRIAPPQLWHMCLYICIGANSTSFANTSALVTCVKNFPASRGIILGLLKGFVGLGGAILTQFFHAFYGDDSKSLILLISWLPVAFSIIFLFTIREMKVARQANELKVFYSYLYIGLALTGYIMVMIIIQKWISITQAQFSVATAIVILMFLLPFAVVIKEELHLRQCKVESMKGTDSIMVSVDKKEEQPQAEINTAPLITEQPAQATSKFFRFISMLKSPERGEDHTILQALYSLDMQILFLATIFGVGGNLTVIDNMGQIGESLGYPAASIGACLALISIWNFYGRAAAGFGSEILLGRFGFPRPLMLTLVLLISCIGHILIAFPFKGSLYIVSIIIGFTFGAQLPLIFAIISEIFGLKHYSTLFNVGALASPIGSYILNVHVAGHLYDKEALKQRALAGGQVTKGLSCIGVECYRSSFFIITAVTVFASLVSLILAIRTRKFYRMTSIQSHRGQYS